MLLAFLLNLADLLRYLLETVFVLVVLALKVCAPLGQRRFRKERASPSYIPCCFFAGIPCPCDAIVAVFSVS